MSKAIQVIGDPRFIKGFRLMDTVSVPNIGTRGYLFSGSDTSRWKLCEWNTRLPLNPNDLLSGTGWQLCRNQAKTVGVATNAEAGGDLFLQVSTFEEYGHALRTTEMPWVHLLVDQKLPNHVPLRGLESARLSGRIRLHHYRQPNTTVDSHLHAAQYFIYFTVSNRNQESPGFSDYYWFGIPFFDSRADTIPDYQAEDFGGTEKYIYTPGTRTLGLETLRTLNWMSFDLELKPWLLRGLTAAWDTGHLRASVNIGDYAMTAVNMGWEVPGTFDVGIQVEGLACWVRHIQAG